MRPVIAVATKGARRAHVGKRRIVARWEGKEDVKRERNVCVRVRHGWGSKGAAFIHRRGVLGLPCQDSKKRAKEEGETAGFAPRSTLSAS
jgi:hypothetical protein